MVGLFGVTIPVCFCRLLPQVRLRAGPLAWPAGCSKGNRGLSTLGWRLALRASYDRVSRRLRCPSLGLSLLLGISV